MSRKKEIENAAKIINAMEYRCEIAFIQGAEWADQNPKDPNDIIIDLIHQRSIAFDQVRETLEMLRIAENALSYPENRKQMTTINSQGKLDDTLAMLEEWLAIAIEAQAKIAEMRKGKGK